MPKTTAFRTPDTCDPFFVVSYLGHDYFTLQIGAGAEEHPAFSLSREAIHELRRVLAETLEAIQED